MAQELLDDVTVIDASQAIPGPVACGMLADLGADVIALEPPGGKTARNYFEGYTIPTITRNKRSIVLNLKTEAGKDVLHRMVEDADVFIHNNRPGVSERLGCGYEELSAVNPELVYCSVTGVGESGPYRDRPMMARLASALAGTKWRTDDPEDIDPAAGEGLAVQTGFLSAFAILAALWGVERTGEGGKVETTLFDTAAYNMSTYYTMYSKEGEIPPEQADRMGTYAPLDVFETATGPIFLGTPFDFLWERLCEAIGREDLLEDPRFESDEKRREHEGELNAELEAEFRQYDRAELLERLHEVGVTASEVKNVPEALEDSQLQHRGVIQEIEDTEGEEVYAAATPVRFSDEQPEIRRDTPGAGDHTEELLAEYGYTDAEIERFLDEGVVYDEQGSSERFQH